MKTYKNLSNAVAALKSKTGKGKVAYFVDGEQVNASTYRVSRGSELIYRSGFEIHAEKTTTNE